MLSVPRAVCWRCHRPQSVCYCRHVTRIETATRVLLLQHPRERDVAIGTARMASLCLARAELHVGVDWRASPAVTRALADRERPAVLLYPGPGAVDVLERPPAGPITLVVIDGTWSNAKKVLRDNPQIAALPRLAFTPPAPSEYRIRREPRADYVSTIEALCYVLGALEGDPERFGALLVPFRAMIDAQLDHIARRPSPRHAHAKKPKHGPVVSPVLRERFGDLVCVVAEANAWPYRLPERRQPHQDELVHWLARRVSSGETFEEVLAPRHPLSPATPAHIDIDAVRLHAGETVDALHPRWRAFVRAGDVICSWGHYAPWLFSEAGGALPDARLDMREVARNFVRGKVGTIDEFGGRLGLVAGPSAGLGRGGRRLAKLAQITRYLAEVASVTAPIK